MMMIYGLLVCCASPLSIDLTQSICGETLTCHAPEVVESQVVISLPFYTSGFE